MSEIQTELSPLSVEVVLHDDRYKSGEWTLPDYATPGSAALDIRAAIAEPVTIAPGETKMIPSGLAIHLATAEYAGLLMPRSGLGSKQGVVLGNLIGLIDSDYSGEMGLAVWNRNHENTITINPGDRIAQYLVVPVKRIALVPVNEFSKNTERGAGGFGSTGVN